MAKTIWLDQTMESSIAKTKSTSGGSIMDILGQYHGTSDQMLDVQWRQMRQSNRANEVHLVNGHRKTFSNNISARAAEISKQPIRETLQELSGTWGMAWADIARMVGVSVPALRKWRTSGGASGENLRRVAGLLAFIQVLNGVGVREPAAWISIPLVDGYTVAPRHLYESGTASTLVDIASSSISPAAAIDELLPSWRIEYSTNFEVVTADDGYPAVIDRRRVDG